VNAGHAAPMLVRSSQKIIERLDEGGPVLGLLPKARYLAGTVKIESSDMIVLYSDGINEATNQNDQEYGEDRITELISDAADATASEMCGRLMKDVTVFARAGVSQDDRTLMVVRFLERPAIRQPWSSGRIRVGAVA
jgi:sigma-B regulation protein RsbU (phosphoserine phosphatase)